MRCGRVCLDGFSLRSVRPFSCHLVGWVGRRCTRGYGCSARFDDGQ